MNLRSRNVAVFLKTRLAFLTLSRRKRLYNYDYIYCDVSKIIWQGVLVSRLKQASGKRGKQGKPTDALL